MAYPDYIKESITSLCARLRWQYPEFFNSGKPEVQQFISRMEMGLYIELIKAGLITSKDYDNEKN